MTIDKAVKKRLDAYAAMLAKQARDNFTDDEPSSAHRGGGYKWRRRKSKTKSRRRTKANKHSRKRKRRLTGCY